jgi:hypothetical protein
MNTDFVPLFAWWVFWLTVLIPAGMVGLCGIIEAFQGARRTALLCGGITVVPALAFFASVGYCVWGDPEGAGNSGYIRSFWLGLFPLGTAFWSILLAYLVPASPPPMKAPDEWPPVAP